MTVVAVANPKGGAGKSTLSTNLAGYWASQGHTVMLGDADRQQSSRTWLALRPAQARPISTWDVERDHIVRPPRGTTHVVLDTPAGLHGKRLAEVVRIASRMIVPLTPSIFDMYATRDFIEQVQALRGSQDLSIAVVGMRVKEGTKAADQLQAFIQELGLPALGHLRDTQNYLHLAAHGLTLWDVAPGRVEKDLAQWAPICAWADA